MKRAFAIASVATLAASAIAGGAAAGRQAVAAKPATRTTLGSIETLAIDGRRIAYDVAARGPGCNRVHVWDAATKRDVVVSGPRTCGADSTSTGAGVRELAVAGSRVAWIVNLGGNTESADILYGATVSGAKERKLASAIRTGEIDGELNGTWLGNLAGDGALIAVNRWTTADGSITSANVSVLRFGLASVRTGPDSMDVMSVDSGRIAVLLPTGVVKVFDATGSLVSFFLPNGRAKEVALRKDYVVVLVPGALEIWNSITGRFVDTIPVPAGARSLDVHANIATLVVGRSVRAVRLATEKQATVAVAPKRIVALQIDDAGLAYAYNPVTGVKGLGKIVYLPLSLVQAKLSLAEEDRVAQPVEPILLRRATASAKDRSRQTR